jgi:trehalose 6-phosphate synthase/phosphatase
MQTHLRVTRVGVVKWRGWHGNHGVVNEDGSPEAGVPRAERHLVEACLRPLNCVPVWIDAHLFGEMYNGFCKGVLWPVLHNVTSVYANRYVEVEPSVDHSENDREMQFSEYSMDDVEQGPIHGGHGREAELWSSYNTVNRKFAEVVVQCFNEGDLVWIHGFHLLILPSYLTRRIPMAKVGIFLHTPFPSSEIFRTVWCREDLLRGMLNADQVGFHLFEYSRHFLTACRRLLGLNYGMVPDASGGHTLAIDTNGRHVAVTSIHAGVEPPVLNQILTHSSTLEKCAQIRRRFDGMHICCAIDRLESLKGIPLKLLGLERFLNRCPEWVGKIVLIQVGVSAFERGDDYFRTKKEVSKIVEKINAQWPGTVQFQECAESEMRLQQRMALLRASDTMIVTAIRDGLNLLPLEYTIAHQDALTEIGRRDCRKRGICILSEFSSSTRVMRGALHINPWKISEIATALHQAVNISEEERLRRISIASEFVTRVTTQRWALAVMLDLKGVHKSVNPLQYSGAGIGLGYRLLGMHSNFVSLDTNVVAKAYKNSRARLILVDYGGTIVSNDNVSVTLQYIPFP